MLNWFRSEPRCPVSEEERTWIELRFGWLLNELGIDRLRQSSIVLPTTEFFPGRYRGTDEEINALLHLVAEYMGVPRESLQLQIYYEDRPQIEGFITHSTAGLYSESEGAFNIWIEDSTLNDPLATVSTMAHEIGHVVLLGERRLSPEEEDHEELTDLLTVFLGLGIICANSVIQENNWRVGRFSGWSIGRRGYLTMDMYGYALAIYLLLHEGFSKSCLTHMRPDVRVACRNGIRYIEATGKCSIDFGRYAGRPLPNTGKQS